MLRLHRVHNRVTRGSESSARDRKSSLSIPLIELALSSSLYSCNISRRTVRTFIVLARSAHDPSDYRSFLFLGSAPGVSVLSPAILSLIHSRKLRPLRMRLSHSLSSPSTMFVTGNPAQSTPLRRKPVVAKGDQSASGQGKLRVRFTRKARLRAPSNRDECWNPS